MCPCYADADTVCPQADGDVELSNFDESYFELSKLTLIPGGKVAMLLAVQNCSEVGRSCPRGARRPRGTPAESK